MRGGPRYSGKTLAKWRKARCVELALAGHSFDEIALEVGYANRGTAWRAVQDSLNSRIAEAVTEYRELELARLDALQAAHWPQAIAGSVRSADLVLRVIDRRMKLLGLDQSACRTTGRGTSSSVPLMTMRPATSVSSRPSRRCPTSQQATRKATEPYTEAETGDLQNLDLIQIRLRADPHFRFSRLVRRIRICASSLGTHPCMWEAEGSGCSGQQSA